ncbi:MAG: patatin-like phospholipase family protein, partial [Ilumatobacteraceae bacterium]
GAKSIAYAGALRATRERGLWFGSVAGASAGAITASLIASGMDPDALESAIPDGLGAVRAPVLARLGKAVIGHATSVFDGKGLRTWLDRTLAKRIGKESGAPVTFAELHASSGIELYVIAMDLATALPVVFCRRTTPGVEVAGAVASSAAIPAAFPAGRAVFGSPDDGAVVHQLIDGSSYANYPAFIFQDRSFRTWLRGESASDDDTVDAETARPVVGYILGEADPPAHRSAIGFVPLDGPDINRRFDVGPTYTSSKRGPYLFGALLSSDWARLIVGVALLIWVALTVAVLPVGVRRFSTWLALWMPDALYPFALVGALSVVIVAIVVAVGFVAVVLLAGRLLADTLLPSIKAVLGVPLDVPPWTGLGADSLVIRVPDDGLKTVDFGVAADERTVAIEAAYAGVRAQLEAADTRERLRGLFDGASPLPASSAGPSRHPDRPPASRTEPDRASMRDAAALVGAACFVGVMAWRATTSAGVDEIGRIVVAVVLGIVAGVAAIVYVGGRAGRRAAARARFGVGAPTSTPDQRAPVTAMLFGAAIVCVLAGGVLSIVAMADRSDDTFEAQVVGAWVVSPASAAASDAGDNEYAVSIEGTVQDDPVASDRHLRLGERIFVERDGDTLELVGALDDGRFAASVVLWVFGLGLLTSAVRSLRWATRTRRLRDLVTEWVTR